MLKFPNLNWNNIKDVCIWKYNGDEYNYGGNNRGSEHGKTYIEMLEILKGQNLEKIEER